MDTPLRVQGQLQMEPEVTSTQAYQSPRMTSREKHRRKMDRILRKDLHKTTGRQATSSRMQGMDKKQKKYKEKREMRQRKPEPESAPADDLDDAALEAGHTYGFDIDFGTGTQVRGPKFYRKLDSQLNKLLS